MYQWVFENQVDIVAGDGNQHMQFHSRKHHKERRAIFGESSSDIANGIFNVLGRALVGQTNQNQPYSARVNMTTVDSNVFTDSEAPPQDPDCMFCQIFHWGKTETSHKFRTTLPPNYI